MCRLVESIKVKDGVFYRLKFHQLRINQAFETFFADDEPLNLFQELNQSVVPQLGIYKCRIVYDDCLQELEYIPYNRREINSLKLVSTQIESRNYKLADRKEYNEAFALRVDCDDVLLVKDGLITDCSYSNVALFDGVNWVTPLQPLLYGTNRAELIQNCKLIEKDIEVAHLGDYKQICLFNAMIEFGELVLDIDAISK